MAPTTRYLMTLLTFTASVLTVGEAVADGGTDLRIVVHVDNYAGIRRYDRVEAEDVARQIFARAGVHLVWATGADKADSPGLHVRVQLLSSDMAMQQIESVGVADDVFGRAARGAGRAYIYTHRIADQALRHSRDFRRLLGLIMAHELGHLVLPSNSHSADGIMRPSIRVLAKSGHDFTAEQGVAMRSMLAAVSPHALQPTDAAFAGR